MKPIYRYDHVAKMWLQQWTEEYIVRELCGDPEQPRPLEPGWQALNALQAQANMAGQWASQMSALQNQLGQSPQSHCSGGVNPFVGLTSLLGLFN